MKFKGTIVAVIVIVLLAVFSRFGFNESFDGKEVIVEPTEDVTLGVLENTAFTVLPTGN
ncbi:MAG: hypothetical protein IJ297_02105 [Clostridia bacterium]|nr:hypothetical protein [Clostridia bacterium]